MSTYLDLVKPTYIEAWPNALCALSIAQVDVPLTVEQSQRLGTNIAEYGETFGNAVANIADIREAVRSQLAKFPNGAFIRLGSRSPKDSWAWARTGFKVTAADADPLRFLTDTSERISDDLHHAIAANYAPHIWIRQWMDIEPWAEFRCFMIGREFAGMSQYDHLKRPRHEQIVANADSLVWAIRDCWFPGFRAACHLADVVFDVFVLKKTRGRETEWQVHLLEINPLFEMTDPCLFNWARKGEFDGRFLYVK